MLTFVNIFSTYHGEYLFEYKGQFHKISSDGFFIFWFLLLFTEILKFYIKLSAIKCSENLQSTVETQCEFWTWNVAENLTFNRQTQQKIPTFAVFYSRNVNPNWLAKSKLGFRSFNLGPTVNHLVTSCISQQPALRLFDYFERVPGGETRRYPVSSGWFLPWPAGGPGGGSRGRSWAAWAPGSPGNRCM